ncbi:hypothetical protein ACFL35_02070 [Candidatus Riflebacteria bacterium]
MDAQKRNSLICPYCFFELKNADYLPEIGKHKCDKCGNSFFFQKEFFDYSEATICYFNCWKKTKIQPASQPVTRPPIILSDSSISGEEKFLVEKVDAIVRLLWGLNEGQVRTLLHKAGEALNLIQTLPESPSWLMQPAEAKKLMREFARDELKKEHDEFKKFLLPNLKVNIDPDDERQVERRYKDYLLRFKFFPEQVTYENMRYMSIKELDFFLIPHCLAPEQIISRARHLKEALCKK